MGTGQILYENVAAVLVNLTIESGQQSLEINYIIC
jgi:hypothetical protein